MPLKERYANNCVHVVKGVEEGAGMHALTLENSIVNKNELSSSEIPMSKPKIPRNVNVSKHHFERKRPMKMKVQHRAKMIALVSAHCGGKVGSITLPPLTLELHTMYYMNLTVEGGTEPPS